MKPVEELKARRDIAELFETYCRTVDERAFSELGEIFTASCVASFGDVELSDRNQLLEFVESGLERFSATSHHVTNLRIRFESEDRATAESYIHAWHRRAKSGRPDLVMNGRYRDVPVSPVVIRKVSVMPGGGDPPKGATTQPSTGK